MLSNMSQAANSKNFSPKKNQLNFNENIQKKNVKNYNK